MTTILDGKKLRDKKITLLKEELLKINNKLGLVVIQVGEDEASKVYVRQKEKLAKNLGYYFKHKKFASNISNEELISYVNYLNNLDNVDGIIVQMPLPKHIDASLIQNSISPYKDVDGLTEINHGKLVHNENTIFPCTPKGIIDLLDEYNVPITGSNVVIIGRSILVGKPLSLMLTNKDATVTLLHSKSKNIEYYTKNADILIAAIGKKHFIKEDMVKDNSTIIDVGINRENGKLYGDVDYDNVYSKVDFITPVPGGVGPMTVYELMNNVYIAHNLRKKVLKK